VIIDGKFALKAPIQKVWDLMLQPGTLASCLPGAEKIEAIDDTHYNCLVKQSVGPISVKLQFAVELTEIVPPKHVKAVGKGEALGKLGTFTMELVVDLNEMSNGEVEAAYSSSVNIVGKLATFGERIMRAKSKQVVEDFTKNLQKKLATLTEK
jgi:carbon monoxide dehydrogenase subunit G